jgi:hypothetical protein
MFQSFLMSIRYPFFTSDCYKAFNSILNPDLKNNIIVEIKLTV